MTTITQPDITLTLDLQGVIRDATLSGTIPGEEFQPWFGRNWGDTVGGGGDEQVRRMIETARVSGVSAFGQVTQTFPSGLELPIEYTAVRLGERAGLIAVGKNLLAVTTVQTRLVASQHASEQDYWKLREAETRYRLLFDASNDAVVVLHADTLRIVEANPAASLAFGLGAGDDFSDELARPERDRFQGMLIQARTNGRAPGMIVHLGGEQTPWMLRSSLIPSGQGPVFLLQLARAGEAERPGAPRGPVSLDELADRLPDPFAVIDQGGIVRRANTAFLDIIQASAEGAVVGEHLGRWLRHPGADLSVILAIVDRHLVLRRMSTTIYGDMGRDSAVEISAVGTSDVRPRYIGVLMRNVERRPLAGDGSRPEPLPELGKTPLLKLVRDASDAIERHYIVAALGQADGNRSAAADLLGLSRQTLYMKLGRYGLEDHMAPGAGRSD